MWFFLIAAAALAAMALSEKGPAPAPKMTVRSGSGAIGGTFTYSLSDVQSNWPNDRAIASNMGTVFIDGVDPNRMNDYIQSFGGNGMGFGTGNPSDLGTLPDFVQSRLSAGDRVWITPQSYNIVQGTDGSTYPVYPVADLAIYAGSVPPSSLSLPNANPSVTWYEVVA